MAQGGVKVVSLTHRPLFTHRKYSWYSFLLEAESTPGPWCDRKDYDICEVGIPNHTHNFSDVIPFWYITRFNYFYINKKLFFFPEHKNYWIYIRMNYVKQHQATYIIISFSVFLPDDCFLQYYVFCLKHISLEEFSDSLSQMYKVRVILMKFNFSRQIF